MIFLWLWMATAINIDINLKVNMHINKTKFISPNYAERIDAIDSLIVHSTHMPSVAALERLCDKESSVSCHYLIDLDGMIYQLVPEDKIAWHAGVSYWAGRTNLNKYSIGIELVDRFDSGDDIVQFPHKQIASFIELAQNIITRQSISNHMILAHSDIAPDRKDDPGEHFPWEYLAKHNIGLCPKIDNSLLKKFAISPGNSGDEVLIVQQMLSKYGYKISCDGVFGKEMSDVVKAFKRHFDQRKIDNIFDEISLDILRNILTLV
jgi:N-acetylmuramoyl-L-alanine amidase